MVKKDTTEGSRKSARILAMEEKARLRAIQKQTKASSSSPPAAKKRGRKRKSLQAVVTNSVSASPQQEGEEPKPEDYATKAEQTENSPSLQRIPKKQTLEFVLDILQRRDTQEIFAQPVDPQEVVGYYSIIKEPMDFGTMRAKLQEGMYTSLQQFERDVFLISSNAMKFNSSTTVYYTEARAISELAQRLFHALRTEPENFQLEYSRTRRRPGRKPQSEAGGLHSRTAKTATYKDGISLNEPSLKRTANPLPQYKPYIGQTSYGIVPVTRDVRESNSSATERRMTYLSQNSSLSENEKLVSTVYNAPKPLAQVSNAGPQYAESLMKFVKDLGPTAQSVANKKLGKCPIEAPNIPSWTLTPPPGFGKTADSLLPVPSALQNPAYLNGANGGQMPCNIISNPPGSYKGKMVCTDGGMNNFGRELIPPHNSLAGARPQTADGGMNSFGRGLIPPHNSLAGARPQTTGGGMNSFGIGLIPPHNSLAGARPQTTDGGMNSLGRGLIPFHNSLAGARPQTTDRGMNSFGRGLIPPYNSLAGAKPQTTDGGLIDYNLLGKQGPNKSTNRDASGSSKSSDNMDLFIATLMQISAIQNRTNHTPSGTYFPLTGYEDFPSAPLSQINKESQSWLLNNRSQPTSLPYQTSQLSSTSKATSSTSSLSGFPNGEGSSTAAPAATAFNQNMPMEWKQSAATQNVLLQQQAQVLPTQEKPMFNAMNFVGGAKPQGHQAESSSQGFWKAIQSSLMDNKKQPDLDLQL